MSEKHRKTYDAIHSNPARANIAWNDAVAMADAFGSSVVPGGGSMFSFKLNGVVRVIHRSYPGGEMSRSRGRDFRAFLEAAGANPDDL